MHNPLLGEQALPQFLEIRPEHVEPAMREVLTQNRARIEQLAALAVPTFATVVEPLEELHHRVARTWSPVSHLNAVLNSHALRSGYNACLPLLSAYQTDLAQSEPLFRAYRTIVDQEGAALAPVQRQVIEHAMRDFRLAGVGLPGERKERFKAVMLELTQLQSKFEENVLDATNGWSRHVTDAAELRGLNDMLIEQARRRAHEQGKEGWILNLDQPTYVAVVTDAESEALRRAFYEAWMTRASDRGPAAGRWDNSTVMGEILCRRHEAARLLDFRHYPEYALATRMAHSVEEVLGFLHELAAAARPAALEEFAELEAFAGRRLAAWDVGFYAERLQRERFSVSQEELRPYFPLPKVLAGLFEVAARLFGVTVRERRGAPVWHEDVRFFEIVGRAGEVVGSFYLDAYARPNKRSGAWMDECIGRKQLPSGAALPVAYLVCNFLPPGEGRPALLTHDDVLTLFHEFGHGLHHLLTQVDYPSLAGINGVAWDAVELPSQFLENYAWHPEVLQRISGHFESGLALPADTQSRLIATRSFHAGLSMMRQLEFALFDFRIHAEYSPERGGRVLGILEEVRREVAVVPVPEWNRFPNSFGHIFAGGYAAGYYSYKWAEVLAADAFAAFEERGVFDRATAQRFLDAILSRGGSRDALEAFIEFRGRRPDVAPLLRQHGILGRGGANRVRRSLTALAIVPLLLLYAVAPPARAEEAYVIEQLVVSLYSTPDAAGERIATVKSGDRLEVLEHAGEQVRVRTGSGKEGWIRAIYLSAAEPLREQLAARTAEAAGLKEEVSRLQAQLEAARASATVAPQAAPAAGTVAAAPAERPEEAVREPRRGLFGGADEDAQLVWPWALGSALVALVVGFALGVLVLDRRIRRKYGGLRIY